MNREKIIDQVKSRVKPWDMLVIGGGASGLGIAIDAASRGYEVLLLEKNDFAKGTSSRSTKLVHGGVRYLQNGDISLVIEALKERGLMRQNAPHLVRNLPFVIPSYEWWNSPFYGLGLKIYDMMAGKLGLGPSTMLNSEETVDYIPNVKREGLKGGVIYYDGQFDDARMAVSMAQTATDHQAAVLNYFSVEDLQKENDMITGVQAVDTLSGQSHTISARVVINATGVFSDEIMKMDSPEMEDMITPSQGVHIVLDKKFLVGDHAIMVPQTSDGRVMFAVPWHDKVVVGTTDTLVDDKSLEPRAMEQEVQFILENAGAYMSEQPTRKDILSVFAGLRPLAASKGGDKPTKEVSRHHKVLVSTTGLVSILGGKWTTYRKMAEDTVNSAATVAGLPDRPCITQNLPIHGFVHDADWSDPLHVYGREKRHVRAMSKSQDSLSDSVFLIDGQVRWAVEREMAITIEDVLARRTRVLFLDAREAIRLAPAVGAIMAEMLGKDNKWLDEQLRNFEEVASNYTVD